MEISHSLIARVCSGDDQAYAELFELSWEQAVKTCLLILRNKHDAEETAQDAFLKLYIRRYELRDRRSFRSWFYRLIVNTALDRVRKRKVVVDIDEISVSSGRNDILQAERRMLIDEAMQKLSPEERIAIVLVHFNGCTEVEAAEATGWRLGKLKYRLIRARRVLASVIDGNPAQRVAHETGGIQHV